MEEELFNIKSRFGEYPSYKVTKSGKVFSYRQGNILKPLSSVLDSSGYPIVKLYDDTNKKRTIAVHRIVADTFIPNPNNLECINHKDENKLNNEVSNLEWCTIGYNNLYNNRQESITIKTKITNTLKFGKKVLQLNKEGEILNNYPSLRELSRITGYSRGSIKNACLKNKLAYNYFWKFV